MRTKIIIAVIFTVLSLNGMSQSVQYVTLTAAFGKTNSVPVLPTQLVSPCGYDYENSPALSATTTNGVRILLDSASVAPLPVILTGLANVSVINQVGTPATWGTFKITTPATPCVISNYIPADAIVIPASATGNVQIILESSPDLVNWTAASPGTYGASAGTNRFFRVRAQVN